MDDRESTGRFSSLGLCGVRWSCWIGRPRLSKPALAVAQGSSREPPLRASCVTCRSRLYTHRSGGASVAPSKPPNCPGVPSTPNRGQGAHPFQQLSTTPPPRSINLKSRSNNTYASATQPYLLPPHPSTHRHDAATTTTTTAPAPPPPPLYPPPPQPHAPGRTRRARRRERGGVPGPERLPRARHGPSDPRAALGGGGAAGRRLPRRIPAGCGCFFVWRVWVCVV